MNIDRYIKNKHNATQMGIVCDTVRGGDDRSHDLRCGYALALHNGAPDAAAATDDAVDFAERMGR